MYLFFFISFKLAFCLLLFQKCYTLLIKDFSGLKLCFQHIFLSMLCLSLKQKNNNTSKLWFKNNCIWKLSFTMEKVMEEPQFVFEWYKYIYSCWCAYAVDFEFISYLKLNIGNSTSANHSIYNNYHFEVSFFSSYK